jgi:hypothetical protein
LLLAGKTMSLVELAKRRKLNPFFGQEVQVVETQIYNPFEVPFTMRATSREYNLKLPTPGGVIVMEAQFYEDSFTWLVLGASMAVFLFCLHGLRVLWPKGFTKGKLPHRDIGCRSKDIDSMAGKWFYVFLVSLVMWAHMLFLVSVAGYDHLSLL